MEKQGWEESEKRREEERRSKKRKPKKKKDPGARKGRKVAIAVFFQWFVAPEGRKVGSLKRRVRSHVVRWEMESPQLWREAHFQVKMYKTHHARTTVGNCDVEKAHAVVARSTFGSQNVQSTLVSDRVWKLTCRKSARRCGAKHISKLGPLLEVEMSKKCALLWREAHVEANMLKALHVRTTFGRSDVVSRGRRKGSCTWSKVRKTWGFCSSFKNVGRRGAFEEDLRRCISRGRRSARDMFIRFHQRC